MINSTYLIPRIIDIEGDDNKKFFFLGSPDFMRLSYLYMDVPKALDC